MIVVVDFNNIVYAAFHRSLGINNIKDMTQVGHFYSGHVDIFRQMLHRHLQLIGSSRVVFALDSKPKHKLGLYPEYKANRDPLPINPKPAIGREVENWSGEVLYADGYEADDAIAAYVARHATEEPITVMTSDKDMWQVLDHENVSVYSPHKQKLVDKTDLATAFHNISEFSHIKLVKALWGDSTDNIKNAVPRMQRYLVPVVKETDGTLADFWDKVFAPGVKLSEKCLEYLKQNNEIIETNYKLASLVYNCPLEVSPMSSINNYLGTQTPPQKEILVSPPEFGHVTG